MRTRTESARARRGNVLVFVTAMVVVMMSAGVLLLRTVSSQEAEVVSQVDDDRALLLAEAGLNEALTALRSGATGNVGRITQPAFLDDGVFWVQSTDLGNNRYDLTVTAMVGSGRRALHAVVEGGPQEPLFQATLNSKDTLTINADVAIDSYDSLVGTYASQVANSYMGTSYANGMGDVRSNKDIAINARGKVFGDATPGPTGSVSFATDSYVSGSTTPATEPFKFAPINRPAVASAGNFNLAAGSSLTLPPGDHGFDAFDLQKASSLTVVGPANIVVRDFHGWKDARLTIDATAGPVTFFVQNSYTHDSGFEAQAATGSPMAVAFMIEGTSPVLFPSGSKVRGGYYAPEADITFTSSNEAWGSFAGNRVSMSNAMRFHYDESLASYWSNPGSGGNGGILAWTEADVQPARLLRDRRDPFRLLQLVSSALPLPAAAWDI